MDSRLIYRYEDQETGEEVLVEHKDIDDVPYIGDTYLWNNRVLRRLPNGSAGDQHEICVKYDGLFRNYQIRRKDPITRFADGRDKSGRPLFYSRASARDFGKRMQDAGMSAGFNDD